MANQENKVLSKADFEFVQMDEKIFDTKFETKAIGYLEDAWIRFRRNKASVVAFFILLFIVLMAIFGPFMSRFTTSDIDDKRTFLPPRMPLVEKLGILDGKQVFRNVPTEILNSEEQSDKDQYPEGTYKIINGPYMTTYKTGVIEYQREEVDIVMDVYEKTFGIREMKNQSAAQFAEYSEIEGAIISSVEKNQCTTINGQTKCYKIYDLVVDYKKILGYDEVPYFLFGTDSVGRDMWTMLWTGTRLSLLIGLIVAIINITIGIIYGSISGYYGGNVDLIMQRIIEILGGVPWIVTMLIVVLYLGNNIVSITIALVMTGWIGTSGMVRTQFYRYKGSEYVLASRTLGAKDSRLIVKHILPNAIGPIVTASVLVIPGAIFLESTISYLGLGLGNGVSIGILLARGQQMLTAYPYLTVFPALVISTLMIAFNLFGNGLRDALNPSLRGAE